MDAELQPASGQQRSKRGASGSDSRMSTQYDMHETGQSMGQATASRKRENRLFAGGFRPRQTAEQEPAIEALKSRLAEDRVTRLALKFLDAYEGVHLKDLTVDWMDDHRRMRVGDRQVVNFGSDSFLGLDRDPRVQRALAESIRSGARTTGLRGPFPACRCSGRPSGGWPNGWVCPTR